MPGDLVLALSISAVLGLMVGAFLNVCIFSLPRNCLSVFTPRAWASSFRGSPRGRLLLVEVLTAALFVLAALRILQKAPALQPMEKGVIFVLHAWFISTLLLCTFINLEFGILPDELTLAGVLLTVIVAAVFPYAHPGSIGSASSPHVRSVLSAVLGVLAGGGAVFAMGIVGWVIFKRASIGLGVVKMFAMVGGMLGPLGAGKALLLTLVLCVIYGVGKRAMTGRLGYVQVGPGVSAASLVVQFWASIPI